MPDPETAEEITANFTEETQDDGLIAIRVTKHGEGKVSTGDHVAELGDTMARKDDVLRVDPDTAKAMEAKGYGEIVE